MEFSVKPSIYIGIIHILQGKRDQLTIQLVLFHETCYGYEVNSVIAVVGFPVDQGLKLLLFVLLWF